MGIENVKAGLNKVNTETQAVALDAIAVTQDERFASLPERYRRAGEVAVELSGLLDGLVTDTQAYVDAAGPFLLIDNVPGGERMISLRGKVDTIVDGSTDDATLNEIPPLVDIMSELFLQIGFGGAWKIELIKAHALNAKQIVGAVEHMDKFLAEQTAKVGEGFTSNAAKIDSIITKKVNSLN